MSATAAAAAAAKKGGKSVNVCVAVRARPLSASDVAGGATECCDVDEAAHTVTMRADATDAGREAKAFTFDHAYGANATQRAIYEAIGQPLVGQAMEGYNATAPMCRSGSGASSQRSGLTATRTLAMFV